MMVGMAPKQNGKNKTLTPIKDLTTETDLIYSEAIISTAYLIAVEGENEQIISKVKTSMD